ncbi:MAG: prepilin-type N-terminal cleavage/methylation domain-containing protein [Candidatus Omnitrophota bacterium]
MLWRIGWFDTMYNKEKGFTPLEKVTDFRRWTPHYYKAAGSFPPKADSPLVEKPLSVYTIRERSSLMGFTIIEFLIVLMIISLLSTIAIPEYLNFQKKAKTAEARANLGAIRVCEEGCYAEQGIYVSAGPNPIAVPVGAKVSWVGGMADWEFLGFEPSGDIRYQYRIKVLGGTTFKATAVGDLDGDGATSVFMITEASTVISESNPLE